MTQDFNWTTRSSGGPQTSDPAWSSQMNSLNIGGQDQGGTPGPLREYSWTITFNNYGRQQFNTAVDDSGAIYINGAYQFASGGYTGWSTRTTPGYFAPGNYTIKMTSNNTGGGPWGLAADWIGYIPPPPPTINSFYADPQTQTSGGTGTPSYSTTLYWSSTSIGPITSAVIKVNDGSGNVNIPNSTSGNKTVNNLPQSTSGSNSPAQRTYTLRLCNNGGCSEDTTTVSVYNDNTPSNTWTTSFGGDGVTAGNGADELIDPGENITKQLGTLSGIDMTVKIESSDPNALFSSSGVGGGANPNYFNNGNNVYLTTTSAPFNEDLTGITNADEYGNYNDKTVDVTVGSLSTFNVNLRTRRPKIRETFDYSSVTGGFPYEDIDVVDDNSPTEYFLTADQTMNDIEIDVEIKSNNPGTQVRINNGTWQNIREI